MQISINAVLEELRRTKRQYIPRDSDRFISSLEKTTGLSSSEEKVYIARAQRGDQHALKELIESNVTFIRQNARDAYLACIKNSELARFNDDEADAFQLGVMGFIHAIGKFNINKPNKLNTYAGWWITKYVKRNFIRKRRHVLGGDMRRKTTIKALADKPIDTIGPVEDKINDLQTMRILEKSQLTPIEREAVERLLGFGTPAQKRIEISKAMGIGRNVVTKTINRALEKMKQAIQKY